MAAAPVHPRDKGLCRVGSTPLIQEWTTTGHVAVRFTDYPPGVCGDWPGITTKFTDSLRRWAEDTARRVPVKEDETFWIPPVAEIADIGEDCQDCDGTGSCRCRCGNEHDCSECHGNGKIIETRGRREQIGQAVFRSDDGAATVIQGKFADLLRGYSVFRYSEPGEDDEVRPLLGVDSDGVLMAVVLPMRGVPETPPKKEDRL